MEARTVHLSASSIASFKACPTRFRLVYVEGLRPVEDTESQRRGTNWHKMHEVYAETLAQGEPAVALTEVVNHLNERYADCPASIPLEDWDLERQRLIISFVGYLWYYAADLIEFLASEVPFELPLYMPRSGMKLPIKEVVRVGKIDHIVKWHDSICALERKSTSRSIADDGDYWDRSKKDTQVSMYALAFRDLLGGAINGGDDPAWLQAAGKIAGGDTRYGGTLYDVWHVPTIKPSMLTQKDTATFIETGEYFGQTFTVTGDNDTEPHDEMGSTPSVKYWVNDVATTVEPGKKAGTFAIKETIEMYGARLLADIQARPTFYFARREISRTDQELRDFQKQLLAVYEAQKAFTRSGCWFENEQQCRATFPCQYIPICYGPGADAVCDGKTTPPNFRRIFPQPLDSVTQEE